MNMTRLIERVLNKIKIEMFSPMEIFRKSRFYKDDENYRRNINLEACFDDRIDLSCNDSALLHRIIVSYKKASIDIAECSDVFRPSNEWLPIYRYYLKEVMCALEDGDIDGVDKIYKNFWREPCSTGLVGLHPNMKNEYFERGGKIGYLNKLHYLNDSIHRLNLWKKLLGDRFSFEALIAPVIGNPYGYFIGDKFINMGADYQHYYATVIGDLLCKKSGRKVVAEIGGGFGGMAYYLIRDSKDTTYVDFDLPENLALTSYYLLKAFPEKKFLLYGEGLFDSAALAQYDIILMPSFELDKLPDETCDLMFNSYSLAEMSPKTINHYVLKSAGLIKNGGWFFHVNHTKKSVMSAKDFPIPSNFSLISEQLAAWNLGRNSEMDEYEFIYKKC
jgi:putative sugar O-methyltransferase